jgi:hypothetical protein
MVKIKRTLHVKYIPSPLPENQPVYEKIIINNDREGEARK